MRCNSERHCHGWPSPSVDAWNRNRSCVQKQNPLQPQAQTRRPSLTMLDQRFLWEGPKSGSPSRRLPEPTKSRCHPPSLDEAATSRHLLMARGWLKPALVAPVAGWHQLMMDAGFFVLVPASWESGAWGTLKGSDENHRQAWSKRLSNTAVRIEIMSQRLLSIFISFMTYPTSRH